MPPVADDPLRALAFAARDGDTQALEHVVVAVHDDVYRLAVRMLWHPEDAKDATQEALVRIVTRIATFRGDAAFRTWAYRVAANHILNWRESRVEQENLTFRRFADQLHDGPPPEPRPHPELATPFVPSTRCGAVEHPIPDRSTRRSGRETEGAAPLRGRIV